jgi:hypothetical protein
MKNEKFFNLFECEKYLSKFSSTTDLENGTRFAEFEKEGSQGDRNSQNKLDKLSTKKSTSTLLNEEYWNDCEVKANTEEGATNLR